MLSEIATFQILGKPLLMWGGLFTLVLLAITALIPILRRKYMQIPYELHVWMARITVVLALFHGVLAISMFL